MVFEGYRTRRRRRWRKRWREGEEKKQFVCIFWSAVTRWIGGRDKGKGVEVRACEDAAVKQRSYIKYIQH